MNYAYKIKTTKKSQSVRLTAQGQKLIVLDNSNEVCLAENQYKSYFSSIDGLNKLGFITIEKVAEGEEKNTKKPEPKAKPETESNNFTFENLSQQTVVQLTPIAVSFGVDTSKIAKKDDLIEAILTASKQKN